MINVTRRCHSQHVTPKGRSAIRLNWESIFKRPIDSRFAPDQTAEFSKISPSFLRNSVEMTNKMRHFERPALGGEEKSFLQISFLQKAGQADWKSEIQTPHISSQLMLPAIRIYIS